MEGLMDKIKIKVYEYTAYSEMYNQLILNVTLFLLTLVK